jgi:hypothetical protein
MKGMKKILTKDAKQVDLVDYLLKLGYQPQKIKNYDYWYLSPLREEKTASFKVNKRLNIWYDFGLAKGGNLIEFGILYHKCSVSEFLEILTHQTTLSFHQQISPKIERSNIKAVEKRKIIIRDVRSSIQSTALFHYLNTRKIPVEIASRFCKEIDFLLYDKKHTTIGFPNNSGGYELRSPDFKGSSSPKDITILGNGQAKRIHLFEGFFDFLSFQVIHYRKLSLLSNQQTHFLVLNSIGFLEKIKPRLEEYQSVHLFLDRDKMGLATTQQLLQLGSQYKDESLLYCKYKDLNEYLIKEYETNTQSQKLRRLL